MIVFNGCFFYIDVEKVFGILVVMVNDVNCFVVVEVKLGVVKVYIQGEYIVFGVIMGIGVGGGIVINGQVWSGVQGIGGEWGYSFLDKLGGECYCG